MGTYRHDFYAVMERLYGRRFSPEEAERLIAEIKARTLSADSAE